MSFTLTTHHKKTGRGGGEVVLSRVTPYVRINEADGPPIFIQNGVLYTEGGQPVKKEDTPEWVSGAIARLTPEVKKEVGLK